MTMLVFTVAAFGMNPGAQAKKYKITDITDGRAITGQIFAGIDSE